MSGGSKSATFRLSEGGYGCTVTKILVACLFQDFEDEAEKNPGCGGWHISHLRRVMALGLCTYDDVPKLRACYLASKEDPSVFVDPAESSPCNGTGQQEDTEEHDTVQEGEKHQLKLDCDFVGFSFAQKELLDDYISTKREHGSSAGKTKEVAGKLFCHMTNFVAMNHGWHKGGNMVPSAYLDASITNDQVDLLNPTPRDVQMAAILDQCSGKKARKVIAKRRIEFISGNVNSYARILNGPTQLQRIKTFNDLSASVAVLNKERDEVAKKAREEKKKQEEEKAEQKAEKGRLAKDERDKLGPGCKADVDKGIAHVLTLNNNRRKIILKIHFGHVAGLLKMKVADTERELRKLMEELHDDVATSETVGVFNDVHDIPLPQVPFLAGQVEHGIVAPVMDTADAITASLYADDHGC